MSGYFERERTPDGEIFTPTTDAVSGWGALVRGPAMTSLMARTVERAVVAQLGVNRLEAAGSSSSAFDSSNETGGFIPREDDL